MKSDRSDIQIFTRLVTDYRIRFIRFANTYVNNIAIAEDIVSDSLVYYWENRAEISGDKNVPAPYVLTVIKHKCLNHLNRLRIYENLEEHLIKSNSWELNLKISTLEACNPEKLFTEEIQQIIDITLSTLPKLTQEIFKKSRYENQSHNEIASGLNLSTKSVEYHITKALKSLRTALKDYYYSFLLL